MAAHSNNFIRVRLHFDYPPPALVDCRMCWLLVDLNTCRVVADLESIIREKFDFSRRSILNLFIEDCYLPHTESIYVVRDNDSVRVKLEYLAQAIGDGRCPDKVNENSRKRQKPSEDDRPEEGGVSVDMKKKKRKKESEEILEREAKQPALVNEKIKKSQRKHKEKKKRKKAEEKVKPAASTKNTPVRVNQPVKTKKSPVAQNVPSSDPSSSSTEDSEVPKKTAPQKPAPKTPSSAPASSTKPKRTKPPSSSSSETSSDESTSLKSAAKPQTFANAKERKNDKSTYQVTPSAASPSHCEQKQTASPSEPPNNQVSKPGTSGSEEEIEFVIHRPVQLPSFDVGGPSSWRGRGGRAKNRRGGPGERGRGEGRGAFRGQNGSFVPSSDGGKQASYQTDSLTNMSVVLQNGAESVPKLDYSSMPLLAAPPQVGQRIAFKLLELTENYTPEVSDYKEGKILSFDHTTKQIELELHNASQAPVEPGKFDLVYQNPDGTERVEYAVSRDSRVVERWDSLLEPRLVI